MLGGLLRRSSSMRTFWLTSSARGTATPSSVRCTVAAHICMHPPSDLPELGYLSGMVLDVQCLLRRVPGGGSRQDL